jgi:cytochrome b561
MSTMRAASHATRIAAGDDRVGYDGLEKTFHWLTVLLVLVLYGLSQAWGFVPRGPGREGVILWHISLGILFTAVVLLRILWRIGPGRRVLPASTGLVELAAQVMHYLLYGLVIAQIVLGFLYRWSDNTSASFFGLFAIPNPWTFSHAQHHLIAWLHDWNAYLILGFAGLHAAAALFHHFVLRDDVLLRMLPGRQARRAERAAPDPREVERKAG